MYLRILLLITKSVKANIPKESLRNVLSPSPRGLSCDNEFDKISSSVRVNSPVQAHSEESRACMAVIDDLLNTIKEIKAFQNEYPNLPAAQASVLRWKHIELMDELQRLRAFQENREHVSFLPSHMWRKLHGV